MFKGVGTAVITPFKGDLTIDYDSFKSIINFQIENGTDALIVLGTTGESPTIENDERDKLISLALETAAGRVPVIAGTGSNNTAAMAKYCKSAEALGAQGLLIVNPYYNKGTQESLVYHYRKAAESSALPIIVYNVPSRTGMNILPDTICKIAEACPTVKAVKEASGNISQIAELIAALPENVSVLSGNDDQTLPVLALGGTGVISTFSNAFPKEMKSICGAFFAGDIKKAQELQKLYLKMMNLMFAEANPIPLKYMMHSLGFCGDNLRLPLMPASRKTQEALNAEYSRLVSNKALLSKYPEAVV